MCSARLAGRLLLLLLLLPDGRHGVGSLVLVVVIAVEVLIIAMMLF